VAPIVLSGGARNAASPLPRTIFLRCAALLSKAISGGREYYRCGRTKRNVAAAGLSRCLTLAAVHRKMGGGGDKPAALALKHLLRRLAAHRMWHQAGVMARYLLAATDDANDVRKARDNTSAHAPNIRVGMLHSLHAAAYRHAARARNGSTKSA